MNTFFLVNCFNEFRCLRDIFLIHTKSTKLDHDQLLFSMIDYYHKGDQDNFFILIDDHLSSQCAVIVFNVNFFEVFRIYEIGTNHYKQLSKMTGFIEKIFGSILGTNDPQIFAYGQKFVMMAVIIQCLTNQNLDAWLQRIKSMDAKIVFQFEDFQELLDNQLEIYMVIAIHQDGADIRECPFLLHVERETVGNAEYIDLRRFNGQNHKLRVLWYLVHKVGSRRWTNKESKDPDVPPPAWLAFSCSESMKGFLLNFISSLGVSFQEYTQNDQNGKYVQIYVDRKWIRIHLGRCARFKRRKEVFNLIMAVKYTVGNCFDGKVLILNYLMEQATNGNWEQFVKSMKIFEDIYNGDYIDYFEIYEEALRYHDRSFLFPVMIYKFHQLFLETMDVKLFIIAQRYFIKGIVEIITSNGSPSCVVDDDQYIVWFDAMSDDRRRHMFECEEAEINRNKMYILSKLFKNESSGAYALQFNHQRQIIFV